MIFLFLPFTKLIMKIFILTITGFLICSFVFAQNTPQTNVQTTKPPQSRQINFNFLGKDSINLSLDEDFDMIEDSCSQIIRHIHLKMPERRFYGHFTDVSRLNPSLVLTDGSYTADGLKEGPFVTRYLNGKLQAKGAFKNDKYDGRWEMFYDDGKPKLTFDAKDGDISIVDAWDENGNKTATNGKGSYRVDFGSFRWKGKLLNGKPDDIWHLCIPHSDMTNDGSNVASESYKNGIFQKGSGPTGDYTDAPRLRWMPANNLPFTRAQALNISAMPCNGVRRKLIANAHYRKGAGAYADEIKQLVSSYLNKIDVAANDNMIVVVGEITKSGIIEHLDAQNPSDSSIAHRLLQCLKSLPPFEPATADGKPIMQKIVIIFNFGRGSHDFSYQLLPIDQSTIQ